PTHRTITQTELLDGTAPGVSLYPDAPTYRSPRRLLTSFSISPVLVGLADRALELAMGSLRKRARAGASPELDAVRLRVAEATAEVETASLILDSTLAQSVSKLAAGEKITEGDILRNRMLGAHMAQMARSAIARLGTVGGSGWVFDANPQQLIYRDAMTGATHRAMSFEIHGASYVTSLLEAQS